MKRLMVCGLALVLATGGGVALADRGKDDRHGGHRGGHGYSHGHAHAHGHGHGYKHGHHKRHWYPRPYYRNVYYYPHHDHRSDYYAPLGAALIGAAVTYSIFHTDHTSNSSSGGSTEVVGCHRIERYPDGSERRVEVPVAECY